MRNNQLDKALFIGRLIFSTVSPFDWKRLTLLNANTDNEKNPLGDQFPLEIRKKNWEPKETFIF